MSDGVQKQAKHSGRFFFSLFDAKVAKSCSCRDLAGSKRRRAAEQDSRRSAKRQEGNAGAWDRKSGRKSGSGSAGERASRGAAEQANGSARGRERGRAEARQSGGAKVRARGRASRGDARQAVSCPPALLLSCSPTLPLLFYCSPGVLSTLCWSGRASECQSRRATEEYIGK